MTSQVNLFLNEKRKKIYEPFDKIKQIKWSILNIRQHDKGPVWWEFFPNKCSAAQPFSHPQLFFFPFSTFFSREKKSLTQTSVFIPRRCSSLESQLSLSHVLTNTSFLNFPTGFFTFGNLQTEIRETISIEFNSPG